MLLEGRKMPAGVAGIGVTFITGCSARPLRGCCVCSISSIYLPAAAGQQRILLRQRQFLPLETYRHYFACDCLFEQSVDAIPLPRSAMAEFIDQADAHLGAATESFVSNILRRFPLDVSKQVESLITQQLAPGTAGVDEVAAQLRLQRRTLQRRLASQGLTFGDILEDVRQQLAMHYLADADSQRSWL